MDWDILVPALLIFCITALVIELFLYAYRSIKHPDRPGIRKRLKTISPTRDKTGGIDSDILRKETLSGVPLLNQILRRVTGIDRLYRLAVQANTRFSVGVFILTAMLLAATGFFSAYLFGKSIILSAGIAIIAAAVPFLYLVAKKQKRTAKFQAQLPEALDMIARSMRAGHAFTTGMRLAADEFGDPLGTEFRYTMDEVNFGVSVPDALGNLLHRVDCADLNFFVVAVILQRETGGNLAEVMEKIAHLIRERFKLLDRIQTLSAEGKLSAVILTAIPFVVAGIVYVMNRKYIMILATEPAGRILILIAIILMMLGFYVMRRIIRIKV
jgi:tight adherence protein B